MLLTFYIQGVLKLKKIRRQKVNASHQIFVQSFVLPMGATCPQLSHSYVIARVIFDGVYKFTLLSPKRGVITIVILETISKFHENKCTYLLGKFCMPEHGRFYIPHEWKQHRNIQVSHENEKYTAIPTKGKSISQHKKKKICCEHKPWKRGFRVTAL